MEEEEQPRPTLEGAKSTVSGISSSSSHETVVRQGEESQQNLASDSFCSRMCTMISKPDIEKLTEIQLETHSKFQKMNGNFSQFNRYSFDQYEKLNIHFQNHTRIITDMKKDLDIVFRRIRNLKTKLSKQYGNAFAVTSPNIQNLEKDVETDHEDQKPQTLQQGATSNNARSNSAVQPLESSSSLAASATGTQTNHEKNQVINRPVLRPQLSSSDDNYDDDDDDDDGIQQHDGNSRKIESSVDDNSEVSQANKELSGRKLTQQDIEGDELIHRTILLPENSSSDESLEDDTDDESEAESETYPERYKKASPTGEEKSINTQIPNNADVHDGTVQL